MYHQSPNYIMSAAQRFYPPAIQQVGPPYPLRLQSQIRTAVQQSGGKFNTIISTSMIAYMYMYLEVPALESDIWTIYALQTSLLPGRI